MEQPKQTSTAASGAGPTAPAERKQSLRASVRAARSRRTSAERTAFAERLSGWTPPPGTSRVTCFVGVGDEPDTGPLLRALADQGIEVLLPITLPDFSLDWAPYTGEEGLVDARYGLREPTAPRLGQAAVGTADIVVIPALAVDADGRRLGQGAGCYDRALPHVSASTPVLAVVYDDERLTEPLPEEPHDRRVDGVLP